MTQPSREMTQIVKIRRWTLVEKKLMAENGKSQTRQAVDIAKLDEGSGEEKESGESTESRDSRHESDSEDSDEAPIFFMDHFNTSEAAPKAPPELKIQTFSIQEFMSDEDMSE